MLPTTLMGPGAVAYGREIGWDPTFSDADANADAVDLVTPASRKRFKAHRERYLIPSASTPSDGAQGLDHPSPGGESSPSASGTRGSPEASAVSGTAALSGLGDTVGVVCSDHRGMSASTISSGGLSLKRPGRVGQYSCSIKIAHFHGSKVPSELTAPCSQSLPFGGGVSSRWGKPHCTALGALRTPGRGVRLRLLRPELARNL